MLSMTANNILGIDLGTTAVKVYLYPIGYSASVTTNAYTTVPPLSSSTAPLTSTSSGANEHKEQNVILILRAIDSAIKQLIDQSGKSIEDFSALIKGIGICDQMHGMVAWNTVAPVESLSDNGSNHSFTKPNDTIKNISRYSNLVTWEDKRCTPEFLASLNQRIQQYTTSSSSSPLPLTPLFSGYGNATLVWYLQHHPSYMEQFRYTGTIGTFIGCYLTNNLTKPVMDPTDAASWGCFNIRSNDWETSLISSLHPSLFSYLPRIVSSGTVIGRVMNTMDTVLTPTLATLSTLTNDIPVYVSIGDHPASMTMALSYIEDNRIKDEENKDGTVSFANNSNPSTVAVVTLGTSAQIALTSPFHSSTVSFRNGLHLPSGCDLRPFICTNDNNNASSNGTDDPSVMMVGASMNGGNILSKTVEFLEERVQKEYGTNPSSNGSENTTHPPWTKDQTYSTLEKAALHISLEKIANISIELPFHEREPVGWTNGITAIDPLPPSIQKSGSTIDPLTPTEKNIRDIRTQPAHKTYTLEELCKLSMVSCGEIYAIAARTIITNILDRLPSNSFLEYHTTHILAVGGAFAKSLLLRNYLQYYVEQRVHGKDMRILFMDTSSEFAGAIGVGKYSANLDRTSYA